MGDIVMEAALGALGVASAALAVALALATHAYRVAHPASAAAGAHPGRVGALDSLAARLGIRDADAARLRTYGGVGLAAVALVALGAGIGLWRTAVLVMGIALVAVLLLRARSRSGTGDFSRQLGDALPVIAASLRSGTLLPAALDSYCESADDPLRAELARVSADVTVGVPFARAVDNMATRMRSEDAHMLATTIAVQAETGAGLADIIDNLAGTIKERQRLKAKADSLTATNRMSARFLTALPILLFAFFFSTSESFAAFYSSAEGLPVLLLIVALIAVSSLILSRMTKIEA